MRRTNMKRGKPPSSSSLSSCSAAIPLLLSLVLFLLLDVKQCSAQLSNPIAHDSNLKDAHKDNKFIQREATDDSDPLAQLDEEALSNTQCPQGLELRWQAEVGSSIYATPVISDINGDGKLEVVVPTFVHYLEVLEGSDGEKVAGWPVQHQSTVHASPLIYDIDKDGGKEIALATFNGEVLFYRAGGYQLPEKLVVPRLKVRKDWYVGLDPDPVDRTKPDVHDESLVEEARKSGVTARQDAEAINSKNASNEAIQPLSNTVANTTADTEKPLEAVSNGTALLDAGELLNDKGSSTNETGNVKEDATTAATNSEAGKLPNDTNSNDRVEIMTGGDLNSALLNSEEGILRRRILQQDGGTVASDGDKMTTTESNAADGEQVSKSTGADDVPTVEDPEDAPEEEAQSTFNIFREEDENGEDGLTDEYAYDYDDYVNEDMWGDEDWDVHHVKMDDMLEVDSHILSTPVIADIDKDGVDEMVVAASYFYDREFYESSTHAKELGEDVEISKYVAGAIVVFNLETKQVKWQVHLDLTTDSTTYRAYIYSAPTVVDLDGDGFMEIIVGNSVGFVYVIDHTGKLIKPFPLLMGEIQGQVIAADINDDGKLEIVSADSRGNVAAWTAQGKELWEVHLKSLISQGPTVGDVDGDGHTDIVVPTTSGNIYVLRGTDGSRVGPYPFRTHGRVMSPALLVDLNRPGAEKRGGLTIAVGSFDGYFYLIDGPTGCAEAVDIGETSYSMALADNVDGGDDLDIIVTTMNGNVYCFQTPVPHHPLKAWSSQAQGRNVFANRHQREGIYVAPSSRKFRDEAGDTFHVTFEIVDKHSVSGGNLGPYQVTVSLLTPGNYRGDKRTHQKYTYEQPGVYTVVLPCLPLRTAGTVLVEMTDRNSLYFLDEFSLTFHMHYYRLLKWLLTFPLLGMTGALLLFKPKDERAPLPSFSRDRQL